MFSFVCRSSNRKAKQRDTNGSKERRSVPVCVYLCLVYYVTCKAPIPLVDVSPAQVSQFPFPSFHFFPLIYSTALNLYKKPPLSILCCTSLCQLREWRTLTFSAPRVVQVLLQWPVKVRKKEKKLEHYQT